MFKNLTTQTPNKLLKIVLTKKQIEKNTFGTYFQSIMNGEMLMLMLGWMFNDNYEYYPTK